MKWKELTKKSMMISNWKKKHYKGLRIPTLVVLCDPAHRLPKPSVHRSGESGGNVLYFCLTVVDSVGPRQFLRLPPRVLL